MTSASKLTRYSGQILMPEPTLFWVYIADQADREINRLGQELQSALHREFHLKALLEGIEKCYGISVKDLEANRP
jgi:hypothetical protein